MLAIASSFDKLKEVIMVLFLILQHGTNKFTWNEMERKSIDFREQLDDTTWHNLMTHLYTTWWRNWWHTLTNLMTQIDINCHNLTIQLDNSFELKFCSKIRQTEEDNNNQASLPVGNRRTVYPTDCALADGWVPPRAWGGAIVCLLGQHWAGGVAASSDGHPNRLIDRAAGRIVLNILCEIL